MQTLNNRVSNRQFQQRHCSMIQWIARGISNMQSAMPVIKTCPYQHSQTQQCQWRLIQVPPAYNATRYSMFSHRSISHLCTNHLSISHLYRSHLSISHLFIDHLSISHLSASHPAFHHRTNLHKVHLGRYPLLLLDILVTRVTTTQPTVQSSAVVYVHNMLYRQHKTRGMGRMISWT